MSSDEDNRPVDCPLSSVGRASHRCALGSIPVIGMWDGNGHQVEFLFRVSQYMSGVSSTNTDHTLPPKTGHSDGTATAETVYTLWIVVHAYQNTRTFLKAQKKRVWYYGISG